MNRKELVAILEEIGTLLELKGENPFKCRAYFNAARNLEAEKAEPGELIASGRLAEIKGIGEALQEKITELVTTGRLAYYEELRSLFPESLFDLLKVPGMGPKKVKAVYEKLGVTSLGELEYACRENRLLALEGFGQKTQDKILKGIEMVRRFSGRFLYSHALAQGKALQALLASHPAVAQISLCGSLRRGREVIGDIDLLVSSTDAEAIMERFTTEPEIETVLARGETKSSLLLKSGIQADLRVVTDEQYPFALNYFTGSKEHNTTLRALAKKKNYKLNEYGLFEDDQLLPCKDEAALYARLGLDYIEPELREDTGEIEAAAEGKLPQLVRPEDIQGIFHVHSEWSDGSNNLESLAKAAVQRGYHYLGIADHSKTAFYARGLDEDRVRQQWQEIDRLNQELQGITLLKGIESDILPDGSLDYSDEVLAGFDFVIASVHSSFGMSEQDMTRRICRALENPFTTMLGHPTGRLLLSRDAYALNLQQVLETAARHERIIELNANPFRLDLEWRYCKQAREMGILISINPDAHDVEGLEDVQYGVAAARRGWLSKEQVFNTRSLRDIFSILKQGRK